MPEQLETEKMEAVKSFFEAKGNVKENIKEGADFTTPAGELKEDPPMPNLTNDKEA